MKSAIGHLERAPDAVPMQTMMTLLPQIYVFARHAVARLSSLRAASYERRIGVADSLMERAEACAGQDPRRAAELRQAALSYLGVVR